MTRFSQSIFNHFCNNEISRYAYDIMKGQHEVSLFQIFEAESMACKLNINKYHA